MIQGIRESKILGRSGCFVQLFCSIVVFHVRDMLSSRLISDPVLDCLRVVVDVFEMVVGGC